MYSTGVPAGPDDEADGNGPAHFGDKIGLFALHRETVSLILRIKRGTLRGMSCASHIGAISSPSGCPSS